MRQQGKGTRDTIEGPPKALVQLYFKPARPLSQQSTLKVFLSPVGDKVPRFTDLRRN
jgi:hypothetical protein